MKRAVLGLFLRAPHKAPVAHGWRCSGSRVQQPRVRPRALAGSGLFGRLGPVLFGALARGASRTEPWRAPARHGACAMLAA